MKSRTAFATALAFLLTVHIARAATFQVTNASDSGDGSLRWAIEQAEATPGADTITTAPIGTPTITLLSPLPPITERVTLDVPFTLDGSGLAGADGMTIIGDDVAIANLRVRRFPGDGVVIHGRRASLQFIESSENRNGILIDGSEADIRGAVIDSNRRDGIWITAASTANKIGMPNFICPFECPRIAGGDEVSGNAEEGIRIEGSGNVVDTLDTGIDGRTLLPLPNGGDGILVVGADNTVINSQSSFNRGHGVALLNTVVCHDNTGICNGGGFIAGASLDAPRLTSVLSDPTASTVTVSFQGRPSTVYQIEVDTLAGTCPDQIITVLGKLIGTTDASGFLSGAIVAQHAPLTVVQAIASGDGEVSGLSPETVAIVTNEARSDLDVQILAPPSSPIQRIIDIVTTLTNHGPAAVGNVKLDIPRVNGLTYVSATSSAGNCYLDGLQWCWFSALGSGETITVHEQVRVTGAGPLQYSASAASQSTPFIDPVPSNDHALAVIDVTPDRRHRAVTH